MNRFTFAEGSPVIVFLHSPKEKIWGLMLSVQPAGVTVRGLDLRIFDEWMRQVAHGEDEFIGLCTIFYPMSRVERMERDETVGPVQSYADRFAQEVGRSVFEVVGFGD